MRSGCGGCVMRLGGAARVVEPPELAESVRLLAADALRHYHETT